MTATATEDIRIHAIKAENYMRTRLVELKFDEDENFVEICGNNGEGKSSVLSAIMEALAGRQGVEIPIHKGETRGEVAVETDRFIVKRIFTEKGDRLECHTLDGVKISSPQKMLSEIFSSISFDPEAFSRMKGKQQVTTLMQFLGLDFAELDAKRKELYDERTYVGRQAEDLRGKAANMPFHEGLPSQPESTASYSEELRNIRECAHKHSQFKNEVQNKEYELEQLRARAIKAVDNIERLKKELEEAEEVLDVLNEKGAETKSEFEALQRELAAMPEPDFEREKQILRIIQDSDDIAVKINENMHRLSAAREADEMSTRYEEMTAKLEEIDRKKRELIAAKEMPVAGLSFDPEGEELLFNYLPLSQASSAERIKVSTLMGFALKPKCKLLLIHNGSLLDNNSRATIARLATENGGLVISEVAGTDSKMGIVIENGEVAEDRRNWDRN